MTIHWLLSRRVRVATHMCRHVQNILNAQRDLLSSEAIQNVQRAIANLRNTIRNNPKRAVLDAKVTEFEAAANKWLKPYPGAGLRENTEVLLVAIAVAVGIHTFFLKPFKIPTGSMQPTLYGITHENFIDRPEVQFPNVVQRFFTFWYRGLSYTQVVARDTGQLRIIDEQPARLLLFNLRQRFQIGSALHTIWFPPDSVFKRAGLIGFDGRPIPKVFARGEDVIKLKVVSGDYLFVDRISYNFRRPKRGEIIVFETKGINHPQISGDDFYIKRMVAMGSEQVRIGNDQHLVINGQRLDASTPHFEHVYSFAPKQRPADSRYSGHLNDSVARLVGYGGLAPLFADENDTETVRPNHYMVMGDNTINSSDSRTWGDFPRENVIGKSFFVFWPFGSQNGRDSRFGWGTR